MVTSVTEHALHEETCVIGAAAASTVVFEGAGTQHPITAGAQAAASHTEALVSRAAGCAIQYAAKAVVEALPLGQAVEVTLIGRPMEGYPLVGFLGSQDWAAIIEGTLKVSEGHSPW